MKQTSIKTNKLEQKNRNKRKRMRQIKKTRNIYRQKNICSYQQVFFKSTKQNGFGG